MYSRRAIHARCAAAAGVDITEFRKLRWPLCPSCSHPMAQEAEPNHVEMEPRSIAPWFYVYLLRCTSCASLRVYAENSSTGLPHPVFDCRKDGLTMVAQNDSQFVQSLKEMLAGDPAEKTLAVSIMKEQLKQWKARLRSDAGLPETFRRDMKELAYLLLVHSPDVANEITIKIDNELGKGVYKGTEID